MAKYGNSGNSVSRSERMSHFVAGHAILMSSFKESLKGMPGGEEQRYLEAAAENLLRTAIMLRKSAGVALSPEAEKVLADEADRLTIPSPNPGREVERTPAVGPYIADEKWMFAPLEVPPIAGHRVHAAGKLRN